MITRRKAVGRFRELAIAFAAVVMLTGRARAEEPAISLEDLKVGSYKIEGHFTVPASPYDVWKVLTDYENISKFVTSLRKSEIKESDTDRLLLEQEALGKVLVFSKQIRVLLQVTEIPYKRIQFEDVLHKDFSFYAGAWEIRKASPDGVEVAYQLMCKRNFVVPNIIAKDALRKSAAGLLSEVRAEIIKRKEGATK